jgi:REP-associated tyrosine transposase
MPQSLSLVIVHVIFSTKGREPFFHSETREAMQSYLAATTRKVGCECYRVGGVEDHVHLVIRLSRTITIANLVEKLKSSSSKWVKTQSDETRDFSWQKGYGCFSIAPRDLNSLIDYIKRQPQHHKRQTFQEEFRMLLDQYGVEYDEAYVWD